MPYAPIAKPTRWAVVPNLLDVESERTADFWERARARARRAAGQPRPEHRPRGRRPARRRARSDHLALRWLGKSGDVRDYSYGDLAALTNRFANVLHDLGLGPGDLVAVLAGRIPELYIAALGTLKNRSVFSPLFSAFGPEPIQDAPRDRQGEGARHDGVALRAEGGGHPRLAARRSSTCCSSATTTGRRASRGRTTTTG